MGITVVIDARPDSGRRQGSLVQRGISVSPTPAKETHCHTLAEAKNHLNSFIKAKPLPNGPAYDDTSRIGKISFGSDFEPRPSATGYDNGIGQEGKKKFEPCISKTSSMQ
ncbi:organ specific protein [Artemisia annua]|uniref:Organ specific protein n=1 Tax=Artemisia annua TaxID=35608 RepID=A0A2U1N4T1_ARTAN|nr:organ specific protein [Artemisia annua]